LRAAAAIEQHGHVVWRLNRRKALDGTRHSIVENFEVRASQVRYRISLRIDDGKVHRDIIRIQTDCVW
jgi:hypothetical protein